jgi:hypothetical protein
MADNLKSLVLVSAWLLSGLLVIAGTPLPASTAEEGQSIQEMLPAAPGGAGVKPEDFIRQFDTLLQGQKLPPEAAGFFQGMKGIMEGAGKGQDPQVLREKSRGLLQGMQSYMEKQDQPPEVTKMFKSFKDMTQPGAAPPKPEEFLQQFEKLIQSNKLPPEAAGFFQGMKGIMEGAGKGQDPQVLREKSRGLLKGAKPLMEKPDLPPEVAEMFKSFQGMMQKSPADRPGN